MVKLGYAKFDTVLMEAVKEGLDGVSPAISDVVLFHLQKQTSIRIDELITDPKAFDKALQKMFGCGAKTIEKKILECLYMKIEAPQRIKYNFEFAEEVKKAQKLLGSDSVSVDEPAQ